MGKLDSAFANKMMRKLKAPSKKKRMDKQTKEMHKETERKI